MFQQLKIVPKLIVSFVLLGLLPAIAIFFLFEAQIPKFQDAIEKPTLANAQQVMNVVDRNLFERYGDVQSFTQNTAVQDPRNWRNLSPQNPLIQAMNAYTSNYAIYNLMLLLDINGQVLAVNTTDANKKPIDTTMLYKQSFADRPWFKDAVAEKYLQGSNGFTGSVVEGPAPSDLLKSVFQDPSLALIFAAPVKDAAGKIVGVWVNIADFRFVEDIIHQEYKKIYGFYAQLSDAKKSQSGVTLIDETGLILADDNPTNSDKKVYQRDEALVQKINLSGKLPLVSQLIAGKNGIDTQLNPLTKTQETFGFAKSIGAYDFPGLKWSVLVHLPESEASAVTHAVSQSMILAILISAAIVLIAGFLFAKLFSKPLTDLTAKMTSITEGNTEISIPHTKRNDEFGDVARAVEIFRLNAIEINESNANASRVAKERTQAVRDEMLSLSNILDQQVQTSVQRFSDQAKILQKTAENMKITAGVVNQNATNANEATRQATHSVESMAAASEELTLSVREISRQVTQSNTIVQEAVHSADHTTTIMHNLSEAAGRVGEVVGLISSIANQTNLLALNATIEAARAGDMGKGFAVVAGEVKNLANQTAKATDEISQQIDGIQAATQNAVKAIEAVSATISRVNEISTAIAAAVEEQGYATSEINRNTQQAAASTIEAGASVNQVTNEFVKTDQMSSEVHDIAVLMTHESDMLLADLRKILRESVAGDRRQEARILPKNLTAIVHVNDREYSLKVYDLANGGIALLLKGDEELIVSSRVQLKLQGFSDEIKGTIEGIANGRARIAFKITDELKAKLDTFISVQKGIQAA